MDTALRSKSEENTKLANLAIQETYYAASIHCSYYACLQLMGHIQRSDFGMTDEDVENEQKEIKGDSHNLLINKFIGKLRYSSQIPNNQRVNIEELFTTNMRMLRTKRKKADYENKKIGRFEANESLRISNEIIEILTKYFTV